MLAVPMASRASAAPPKPPCTRALKPAARRPSASTWASTRCSGLPVAPTTTSVEAFRPLLAIGALLGAVEVPAPPQATRAVDATTEASAPSGRWTAMGERGTLFGALAGFAARGRDVGGGKALELALELVAKDRDLLLAQLRVGLGRFHERGGQGLVGGGQIALGGRPVGHPPQVQGTGLGMLGERSDPLPLGRGERAPAR